MTACLVTRQVIRTPKVSFPRLSNPLVLSSSVPSLVPRPVLWGLRVNGTPRCHPGPGKAGDASECGLPAPGCPPGGGPAGDSRGLQPEAPPDSGAAGGSPSSWELFQREACSAPLTGLASSSLSSGFCRSRARSTSGAWCGCRPRVGRAHRLRVSRDRQATCLDLAPNHV